jgi:mannose-6-phosphate isomerase-like protein (cupin superfamily)
VTLNKGDIITIPRGTPHRRTTTASVTFLLLSPTGSM